MSAEFYTFELPQGTIDLPPFPKFNPVATAYLRSIRDEGMRRGGRSQLAMEAGRSTVAAALEEYGDLAVDIPDSLRTEDPTEDQRDIIDTYIFGASEIGARAYELGKRPTAELETSVRMGVFEELLCDAAGFVCIARSLGLRYETPVRNIARRSIVDAIGRMKNKPNTVIKQRRSPLGSTLILAEDL